MRDKSKSNQQNGPKELQTIKELCNQMLQLSTWHRKETALRSFKDLAEIRTLMHNNKTADQATLMGSEAVVAIVNVGMRKQILKEQIQARIADEKELIGTLQAHRDEFSAFIWKRRMESKKEMREMFQSGTGTVFRFGDLLSDTNFELIQSLEKTYYARLCKDAIEWGLADEEDIPSYFNRKIVLTPPKVKSNIIVLPSRLECQLQLPQSSKSQKPSTTRNPSLSSSAFPPKPHPLSPRRKSSAVPAPTTDTFSCVYATNGIWAGRLLSKPSSLGFIQKTLNHLQKTPTDASYVHLLARLIDCVHPSHQLQATVLSYPLSASLIIKRRLSELGYDVETLYKNISIQQQPQQPTEKKPTGLAGLISSINSTVDEAASGASSFIDWRTAVEICTAVKNRLEFEFRFYFEFSAPDKCAWRVGVASFRGVKISEHGKYPGCSSDSFGFASDGTIFWDGKRFEYIDDPQDPLSFVGLRTWGILVDFASGSLALVNEGKVQSPAFGKSAQAFTETEQESQMKIIQTKLLFPMLALQDTDTSHTQFGEIPHIKVNFGSLPFTFNVSANSFESMLEFKQLSKSTISATLPETGKEKEEDDKIQLAIEKSYIRNTIGAETLKSFSQFPPSMYRRSLAATKIQRVWRRHHGAIIRQQMKERQTNAVIIIQRMARKKLRELKLIKNKAAALIQRNWRRKLFIWTALMRCIYQHPIPDLHHYASLIQQKYRQWHTFKNSPIANKYNQKIEILETAVNKIIRWWRPVKERLDYVRKNDLTLKAAINIQRVWRGYYLRQLLRPELRTKLRGLGDKIYKHRNELFKIKGAYVLQSAWRQFQVKKVRLDKIKVRNRAAMRIQAIWKGYWVRSHIHLRFSYGEAVFLTAVCKALKQSHFILKMYKPCGIVCPH